MSSERTIILNALQKTTYQGMSQKQITDKVGNSIIALRKEYAAIPKASKSDNNPIKLKTNKSKLEKKEIQEAYNLSNMGDEVYEVVKNLSYLDIRQLCQTNKHLAKICHNDALFIRLIHERTGVQIDKKFNVAEILFELDKSIDEFIKIHFGTAKNNKLPAFVGYDKFFTYQKKKIYTDLPGYLLDLLDEYYKDKDSKYSKDIYTESNLTIRDISFYTSIISSKLNSYHLEEIIYEDEDFDKYIELSNDLIEYIIAYAGNLESLKKSKNKKMNMEEAFRLLITGFLLL